MNINEIIWEYNIYSRSSAVEDWQVCNGGGTSKLSLQFEK